MQSSRLQAFEGSGRMVAEPTLVKGPVGEPLEADRSLKALGLNGASCERASREANANKKLRALATRRARSCGLG